MTLFRSMKRALYASLMAAMIATTIGAEQPVSEDGRSIVGMRVATAEERSDHELRRGPATAEAAQIEMDQDTEDGRETMAYGTDWGRPSWPYAAHGIVSVGIYGELVEIEDGSTFTVANDSRWVVQGWCAGDIVHLLPNHGYFFGLFHSGYDFCLYNETTGDTVEVSLTLGPFQFAETSWWISAIDDYNGIVWLQDGTTLYVDPSDRHVIYGWQPNDHIILGYNDGRHNGQYPNIIANVATVDYVRVYIAY